MSGLNRCHSSKSVAKTTSKEDPCLSIRLWTTLTTRQAMALSQTCTSNRLKLTRDQTNFQSLIREPNDKTLNLSLNQHQILRIRADNIDLRNRITWTTFRKMLETRDLISKSKGLLKATLSRLHVGHLRKSVTLTRKSNSNLSTSKMKLKKNLRNLP